MGTPGSAAEAGDKASSRGSGICGKKKCKTKRLIWGMTTVHHYGPRPPQKNPTKNRDSPSPYLACAAAARGGHC